MQSAKRKGAQRSRGPRNLAAWRVSWEFSEIGHLCAAGRQSASQRLCAMACRLLRNIRVPRRAARGWTRAFSAQKPPGEGRDSEIRVDASGLLQPTPPLMDFEFPGTCWRCRRATVEPA
eukprot:scaffold377_cov269-Pinguiococcus_pyrenoidosus.AAC.7